MKNAHVIIVSYINKSMLSNSEKIKSILEEGKWVDVTETGYGTYTLIAVFADKFVGQSGNLTLQKHFDLYQNRIVSITPIGRKPKVFAVGDKVDVLECVKEVGGYESWYKEAKQMKSGEILGVLDDCCHGISYTFKGGTAFPHWCLTRHFDEPEEKMVEFMVDEESTVFGEGKNTKVILPISEVRDALKRAEGRVE